MMRDMQITVIFKHACILDIRDRSSVKLVEGSIAVKGHGKLQGTVAAEVEKNNAVAVFHSAYSLSVLSYNKCSKILVDRTCLVS